MAMTMPSFSMPAKHEPWHDAATTQREKNAHDLPPAAIVSHQPTVAGRQSLDESTLRASKFLEAHACTEPGTERSRDLTILCSSPIE